jgi:hypothetical protein
MGSKPKSQKLRSGFTDEEAETILTYFQDALLDFCESQLSNGSRQGDEWCCADLENSPLKEGRRGSCSVNVHKGVFHDKNPAADPSSGGMVDMWCAIFKVDRRDALAGMKKWCKDRSLPDGTTGRSSGRLQLSEDSSIQAMDQYEKEWIGWVKTFQAWSAWLERGVYTPEEKSRYDNLIAWAVSNIYSRRWLQAVEFTQSIRDTFAAELAQLRGLSEEVFRWLIDAGQVANVYERKELTQGNSLAGLSSGDFNLKTVRVVERCVPKIPYLSANRPISYTDSRRTQTS